MKLSIILPCLKRDALVERAILSVGAVPEGVELEWVVVEGVSPVARARNVGLGRATGDYIAWIDGDDEVTGEWLAEIARALRDRPDLILFDCEMVGWRTQREMVYGGEGGSLNPDDLLRDVYRDQRLRGHVWRMVCRRDLWQGLVWAEWTLSISDFLMAPSVVAKAKRIVYVPKKLYRYHQNNASITNTYSIRRAVLALRVAFERHQACVRRFEGASLFGSASLMCITLRMLMSASAADMKTEDRLLVVRARRFLRRNLWSLWRETAFLGSFRLRLRWELKFLVASFGLWRFCRRVGAIML